MKWRCHFCIRFWPSWCGGNWMRYCLKQNLTSWKNQKTFAIRTMRERMLTLGQANDAQLGRSSPNFSSMKGGRDSNSERDAYEPVLVHQSLLLTAWQFCMDFTHSCMSFSFLFPKYFFQQLFFLQKVFTRRHFEKKIRISTSDTLLHFRAGVLKQSCKCEPEFLGLRKNIR